ncbi:hypothetical protein CRUP_010512 [Coryphaenoides rupestris]|nr:hypothetical protein CRUP_010512 [Coryphaenoides rupestris]
MEMEMEVVVVMEVEVVMEMEVLVVVLVEVVVMEMKVEVAVLLLSPGGLLDVAYLVLQEPDPLVGGDQVSLQLLEDGAGVARQVRQLAQGPGQDQAAGGLQVLEQDALLPGDVRSGVQVERSGFRGTAGKPGARIRWIGSGEERRQPLGDEEVQGRRASEVWADSSSKMLSRTVAGAALLLLLAVGPPGLRAQESPTEIAAREFLQKFDVEASHRMYQYSLASWDYNTNITEENSKKLVRGGLGGEPEGRSEEAAVWGEFYSRKSVESLKFPIHEVSDLQIKLQLISLQDRGSGALSPDKAAHLDWVLNEMSTIYSTATVCLKDKPHDCQTWNQAVMADSQDYGERLHVWEGWRREVGKKMRPLYEKYVDLKNEAAQLNGTPNTPGIQTPLSTTEKEPLYHYTRDDLRKDVGDIYRQVRALHRVLGVTGQGAGYHRTGCWVSQDRVLGVTGQGAGCNRTGCRVSQDRVLGTTGQGAGYHRTGCWVLGVTGQGAGGHRTGCWVSQDRVQGATGQGAGGHRTGQGAGGHRTGCRGPQDRILPLYEQLHAYVRSRLVEVYPDHVHPEGPLPAHLLGDMWGRFWTNLYSLSMPYPHKPDIDVSKAMVEQNWEAVRLFQEAEKFFQSVGLFKMEDDFWVKSMLTKPTDGRKVVCHPTAWDMGNGKDYRIKMCTQVNMDHFLTAHHELGHNQYQMAYQNLSYLLRDGANEGFHEAVGEIMSLSAATPGHLLALGLLPNNFTSDEETEINFLMKQALTIVATLPFSYMLEEWRWKVFQDSIPKEEWMKSWWEMKSMLELGRSVSWTKALKMVSNSTRMDAGPLLEYFKPLSDWLEKENQNRTVAGGRTSTHTSIAYAMRQYYSSQKNSTPAFTAEDVCTYKETVRVSFYFLVTEPSNPSVFISRDEVKAAVRLSRGRINDAFQLSDLTLEFDGIPATLAPPVEQPVTVWLVVYGVVMGVVVLVGAYLVISGVRSRKNKPAEVKVLNPYDLPPDGLANLAYQNEEAEQRL